MNRYLCKCGRAVNKSTNADNTGNRETEGCEGCPYLMPWGEQKYNHDTKHFYLDIKGYECRMSQTLEYETRFGGSVTDRCTCYIASLDFDFLERVSAWIKEHYPDGQISGTFSRETIRAVEYVSNGRYRLSISCAQNKAGIAAKAALFNAFFDESGRRFDMDADAEKAKILRDIERGKAAAHSVAAAPDKETKTMLIYRDPATGWLYRVSPQPEHGSYVMQYRDPANSVVWKPDITWNTNAVYRDREHLQEGLEARAKRDGWELVSGPASSEPLEVVEESGELPQETEVQLYPFEVTKFERQRHPGSAKLPPCAMALLTIQIDGGEKGHSVVTHRLYLHTRTEGLLCAFFESIGQRKHGEALRPRWNEVNGSRGRCRVGIHEYTNKYGDKRQSNDEGGFGGGRPGRFGAHLHLEVSRGRGIAY